MSENHDKVLAAVAAHCSAAIALHGIWDLRRECGAAWSEALSLLIAEFGSDDGRAIMALAGEMDEFSAEDFAVFASKVLG